jgi:hypothetical protein
LYTFFTVLYFIGIKGFPSGMWLVLEIGSELILGIDIILRVSIRKHVVHKKLWMLHEPTSLIILALGSLPISFGAKLLDPYFSLTSVWVAYFRLSKLLRYGQISTYFSN